MKVEEKLTPETHVLVMKENGAEGEEPCKTLALAFKTPLRRQGLYFLQEVSRTMHVTVVMGETRGTTRFLFIYHVEMQVGCGPLCYSFEGSLIHWAYDLIQALNQIGLIYQKLS